MDGCECEFPAQRGGTAFAQSTREKGIRVVVHGDDFWSGRIRHQLEWTKCIRNTHLESKHVVMRASSDLGKSLVMLNRKIVWQDDRIPYKLDIRHCESC